jgi:hypothetical protein
MGRRFGFYWSPVEETLNEQLEMLASVRANSVYLPHHHASQLLLDRLHELKIEVFVDRGLFVGEEVRRMFPDSTPITATGQPFDREGWYVPACPTHPDLRRYHLEGIAALLDQHADAINALWLDFVRFPVRWEGRTPNLHQVCFCKHCLNSFLQADRDEYSREETITLAQQILSQQSQAWIEWKCAQVAGFVQEIKALISQRHLSLPLGAFILPWRRTDFDGAIRSVAGQDLEMLAEHVDMFSPMVYHKLCQQSPSWIQSVVQDHAAWSGKPILPIIQSVHSPDKTTPADLDAALAAALDAAPEGVMIFTLAPLLESNELAESVRRHFAGAA